MSNEITYGSLGYLEQNGRSIAETFAMDVAAIVMIDTSGSMAATDCQNGQMRHTVACNELRKLQREIPGKIAIIEWSSSHAFCPGGVPGPPIGWTTDMAGVLAFVHRADDTGIKLILISDGHPDCEQSALNQARLFRSKIDTVFIGPENDPGADFLRRLAALTGGVAKTQSAREIINLADTVTRLLTS